MIPEPCLAVYMYVPCQEGVRVGVETACLALARLVEERGGWALPARFSLPLTSHLLHFHMTGSQTHVGGAGYSNDV